MHNFPPNQVLPEPREPARQIPPPGRIALGPEDIFNLALPPRDEPRPVEAGPAKILVDGEQILDVEGQEISLTREEIQNLAPHVGILVSGAGPRLVLEEGRVLGVAFENLEQSQFLKTLGFAAGDVLVAVNGDKTIDPQDLAAAFNDDMKAIFLTILNGRTQRLVLISKSE